MIAYNNSAASSLKIKHQFLFHLFGGVAVFGAAFAERWPERRCDVLAVAQMTTLNRQKHRFFATSSHKKNPHWLAK